MASTNTAATGDPGSAAPAAAAAGVLVILGASGDLTKRLLLPALYNLACDGLLPQDFTVVGMARRQLDTASFRAAQRDDIRRFHTRRAFEPEPWAWLESRLHYVTGAFDDATAYARLREEIERVTAGTAAAGNTVIYLAISPEFFGTVNDMLDATGFTRRAGTTRIVVEKPFGRDLASATALNRALLARWQEEQIYRIDHYLGKETVQNLLAFRMANAMFAPLWHTRHIDHVQISATETVGVETRGEYYERTGVLRDMLQNHLMQMLAYICMEPPATLDPTAVRDAKSNLLAAVRVPAPGDVAAMSVRGQYGAGRRADGTPAIRYRDEPQVSPDSATPTYAALELAIDNERWAGTPIYLRSGKALWKRGTEIVVQFREGAGPGRTIGGEPNLMIFHIQPYQGVEIRMQAKHPGPSFALARAGMRFDYADTFEASRGTGYEVLLHGALDGDPTLFTRTDFVEQSWRIMQPILDVWESSPPGTLPDEAPFPNYTAGTWGPLEAQTLLARTGRHWHEVINREVLVRSPFFADAPPTLLNMLALSFQPLAVDPGTVVVRAGDVTGDLYVVCRGSLEAVDPSGRRLGTIDEGQCFGEMAVLQDRPRAATVRALAPCDLLVLPADDFRRVIADFPDAERRFREIAASRM